jgi:UDP-N-acetylglucosamine acyltransferase
MQNKNMLKSVNEIHPTAVIADGAKIGPDVKIGPFCTVGPHVTLEEGVELVSHVVIDGRTHVGAGAKFFPFCTVGLAPQDLKYNGEDTATEIGPRTVVREHASIHRGTVTGTGVTKIGADCLLMAVVHVAHDCVIGDGVIMSNNVVLGGHVEVGDRAVIGGAAALLQFVRVGTGAMIGGVTGVGADVAPYCFVFGPRAQMVGLNIVGLRRRGLDKAQLHTVRAAHKFLFSGPGTFAERLISAQVEFGENAFVAEMLRFMNTPSRHGLITQVARATGEME